MNRKFTVDVLGSSWEVRVRKEEEEERLKDCSGFTDWTNRTIYILDARNDSNLGVPERFMGKVMRHEIVHAFLFESGLGDDWTHPEFGHDETFVDWVAFQMYKIEHVCREADEQLKWILKGVGGE